MPATSRAMGGTVAAPPLSIPVRLSGSDEVFCTVTALDDDDIVLVRLDSGHLSFELPLPSAGAVDLSLRLCACVIRLRRRNTTD